MNNKKGKYENIKNDWGLQDVVADLGGSNFYGFMLISFFQCVCVCVQEFLLKLKYLLICINYSDSIYYYFIVVVIIIIIIICSIIGSLPSYLEAESEHVK